MRVMGLSFWGEYEMVLCVGSSGCEVVARANVGVLLWYVSGCLRLVWC